MAGGVVVVAMTEGVLTQKTRLNRGCEGDDAYLKVISASWPSCWLRSPGRGWQVGQPPGCSEPRWRGWGGPALSPPGES